MPQGLERIQTALLSAILAAIPSLSLGTIAWVFKTYRKWSSERVIFYLLEIIFMELFLYSYLKFVGTFKFAAFSNIELTELDFTPLGVVLAIVLGVFSLALINRSEAQIVRRLQSAELLVTRLNRDRAELVLSEEKIRLQTSQFLHDRVQSELIVVAMKLKELQKNPSQNLDSTLSDAVSTLEKTRTHDLRTLVQILSPNFSQDSLEEALHHLFEPYEPVIKVSLKIDHQVNSLSKQSLLGLFRIVEQAILNCLAHGACSEASVFVGFDNAGAIRLLISDNGLGADISQVKPGMGTTIIDSWVSILLGKKEVTSSSGHGYQIEVQFPNSSKSDK